MRSLWSLAGTATLLIATSASSHAVADDTNYRSVPIGAHAIGLGGAFAGVADDASAAFFNPAGLALGGTHGLAGGLTINAWSRFHFDSAFQQPDTTADATTKSSRTVPLFIGAILKLGPTDALEEKKFAVGISVVEPNFSRGGTTLKLTSSENSVLTDTYSFDVSDRGTWYGLSFASRFGLKHLIGASLYLSVRKLSHSEVGLSLDGGGPLPSDPELLVGTSTVANNQDLRFKAFHFVLRFGWLYRIKPQVQLGIMLQPPGIPLKQRVDVLSQGFVNDNRDPSAPTTTSAYFFDQKVKANLPIPAELKVGLQYWPAEKVMLAFDAAAYSPVRSGQRAKAVDPSRQGDLFFDNDTARRAIGNVAIGGDFIVTKKVTIEAGFFTDFSSAINIPADPTRYYNPQINRFGGTLSLALNIAGVSLAVGSTVLYGKGDATGVLVDTNNLALDYTRTQATSRVVYLHVTGATQAATDLGTKSAAGIEAKRARKRREDEQAGETEPEGASDPRLP
jgi:hypothetical protein